MRGFLPKLAHVVLGIALLVGWIIPSTVSQYHRTLSYHRGSIAQQEFASVVKFYLDHGYKIGVYGWWQAPEISFLLGGFRFHRFSCEKRYPENVLVIFTKLQESLSPLEAKHLKQCLDKLIYVSSDQQYFLYSPMKTR